MGTVLGWLNYQYRVESPLGCTNSNELISRKAFQMPLMLTRVHRLWALAFPWSSWTKITVIGQRRIIEQMRQGTDVAVLNMI